MEKEEAGMRLRVFVALLGLIVLFSVLVSVLFSGEVWGKIPAGVLDCTAQTRAGCDRFWSRQSSEAKGFILSYPEEERHSALVCYALHGYGKVTAAVRDCVQVSVGDRKSLSYCEGRGHEIMTDGMEKCRFEYRRRHGYPQPW